jgi:hypothetical protein
VPTGARPCSYRQLGSPLQECGEPLDTALDLKWIGHDMPTKYEALEDKLRAVPRSTQTITMSFGEINALLPSPLPESAYTHRPWWGNQRDTRSRPQAKSWLAAGFEVEHVHQVKGSGWVRFVRSKS